MSEKKKTELEMFARYQQAMLIILQEFVKGEREEKGAMTIEGVVADIARTSNMMIKTLLDKQEEFTEDEKAMYSDMVVMMMSADAVEDL